MAKEPQRFDIPADARAKHCASCKARIFWIETAAGKRMPVDPDGVSHFVTCPNAAYHRKRKRRIN